MQALQKDEESKQEIQKPSKENGRKKLDPAINKYISLSNKDEQSSQWSSDNGIIGQNLKYIQDDYKIVEQLGIGSYGEVVKAIHIKTGHAVAIKFMSGLSERIYRSRQLISEIQILRKLSANPNNDFTTRLFDIIVPEISSEDEEVSCVILVMELVELDLRNTMQNSHKTDFDEAHLIMILYNILCAVNFLHSSNIMHRDIKPANILLDHDCVVKLCDFGLARTCLKRDKFSYLIKEEVAKLTSKGEEAQVGRKSLISAMLSGEQETRRKQKRQISNHVVTRFYRAPEVIFLEKRYDTALDMWSIGCVLAEMITCLNGKKIKEHKRLLFKGTSCCPLSPENPNLGEDQSQDMVEAIIRKIGFPTEEDQSFMSDANGCKYLNRTFQQFTQKQYKLDSMFPGTNPEIMSLLKKLLEFNPYFRITAKEALKSKLFDSVRLKQYEKLSEDKIKLEIYSESSFDYQSGTSEKFKTKADFKKILLKECAKIKKISPLYE